MRNPYIVLGVVPPQSEAEIRQAYHAMALRYHPNRNFDADATEKFREVQAAYEQLTATKHKDDDAIWQATELRDYIEARLVEAVAIGESYANEIVDLRAAKRKIGLIVEDLHELV